MHSYILSTLVVSALLITCNAAYVERLNKCSIKDENCMKDFFFKMFSEWSTTGFPEYNMEPIDPLKAIEKDTVSLSKELNVVIDKGIVSGLKNCVIRGMSIDLEKGIMFHDVFCDLLDIYVDINLSGSAAILQELFGNKQLDRSHGRGNITVEKIGLHIRLGCKLIKGEAGKNYFTLSENKIEHKYDFENIKIAFDRLMIGDQNFGPLLTELVNSNTKLFSNSFGPAIINKVLEYLIVGLEKLYSQIPTQSFIIEDLSEYV